MQKEQHFMQKQQHLRRSGLRGDRQEESTGEIGGAVRSKDSTNAYEAPQHAGCCPKYGDTDVNTIHKVPVLLECTS